MKQSPFSQNPKPSAENVSIATAEPLPLTANCPLCDSEGAPRLFFSKDRIHDVPGTFGVYRCGNCAAVFIQPWPSEAELSAYYPEDYGRYRHSRSLAKK